MFEKQFINWITERVVHSESVPISIGDDACMITCEETNWVITTDTLCDGVHFDSKEHSLDRIGNKCVAVSISDVLAMGACPKHCLLTFFLPKSFELKQAQQLFLAAEKTAEQNGVSIVGGDTNSYNGPLIVGSTLLGSVTADRAWTINGAELGDQILVTGEFGGSILGKHLDFEPRTGWVQQIAKSFPIHATTDVTDSLSLDLDAMLKPNQLGADLFAEKIPLAKAAHAIAQSTGRSPLDHALSDGEDFELILIVEPGIATELMGLYPNLLSHIGNVVSTPGLTLIQNEQRNEWIPRGYEH